MRKKVRKSTRLARGERRTPEWVKERMADRPPWLAKKPAEGLSYFDRPREIDKLKAQHLERFREFMFAELDLRFVDAGIEHAHALARDNRDFVHWIAEPKPTDGRRKREVDKVFNANGFGAKAVMLIREVWEDYWDSVHSDARGDSPISAEALAAEYMTERLGQPFTAKTIFNRVNNVRQSRQGL